MPLPVNAKLIFEVTANEVPDQFDADGNPVLASDTVEVLATLRPTKDPKNQSAAGMAAGMVYLEGRAINPKSIPQNYPRRCRLILTDPQTSQQLTGNFIRELPVQSKFKAVTSALGAKIEGYFTESEGWA